ncbi:MAG TPA: C40 family peptidase, partial [Longimicrobiales bacterium]|nr:C40 family peptidase [Longimicrobiales bacterium]
GGTAVGSSARAALTLDTADRYLGVPYVWGGESPSAGFDCSGFVQYVFARNGVELPRVSRDQARAGRRLATRASEFQPGDLLFFAGSDGVIDHVAIYVGDNTIIHSSASRGQVAYDRLDTRRGSWYATHLVAARRVIPEGTSWSRR